GHLVGEQFVGDVGDLFRLLPRRRQGRELAGERATLDVLVRRHLQRQSVDGRKPEEWCGLVAPRPAASPERTVCELKRDALGEAAAHRLDEPLVRRVGDAPPARAHRERRDAREVPLTVAGFVELGDRVLHFGVARNTEIERRQHLSRSSESRALRERRRRFARDPAMEPATAANERADRLARTVGLWREARESRSISPRRDLRKERASYANELEPLVDPREADVVGGIPKPRPAKEP